jgi:hypothetical protein
VCAEISLITAGLEQPRGRNLVTRIGHANVVNKLPWSLGMHCTYIWLDLAVLRIWSVFEVLSTVADNRRQLILNAIYDGFHSDVPSFKPKSRNVIVDKDVSTMQN